MTEEKGTETQKVETADAEGATPAEDNLTVYSDNVALPEVRTGKVDVEGDFSDDQDEKNIENENKVSYDTVAVPEYHPGKHASAKKAARGEGDSEDEGKPKKKHNIFGDLAKTLMNGSAEE